MVEQISEQDVRQFIKKLEKVSEKASELREISGDPWASLDSWKEFISYIAEMCGIPEEKITIKLMEEGDNNYIKVFVEGYEDFVKIKIAEFIFKDDLFEKYFVWYPIDKKIEGIRDCGLFISVFALGLLGAVLMLGYLFYIKWYAVWVMYILSIVGIVIYMWGSEYSSRDPEIIDYIYNRGCNKPKRKGIRVIS